MGTLGLRWAEVSEIKETAWTTPDESPKRGRVQRFKIYALNKIVLYNPEDRIPRTIFVRCSYSTIGNSEDSRYKMRDALPPLRRKTEKRSRDCGELQTSRKAADSGLVSKTNHHERTKLSRRVPGNLPRTMG